jgi:very-short-patch-repair endonuclease
MEPLDATRPFTRHEAQARGVTDGRLRGPGYRQLFRGVYVASSLTPTLIVRARAALLIHPDDAVVGGLTAAALLELPVTGSDQIDVRVVSATDRRPRPGLRSTTGAAGATVGEVGGVPVVTGATLFLQCAQHLCLVDLVVLGDAIVRRRMTTPEALVESCAEARGRDIALARRAAGLVRRRVDSAMESRLRMLLLLAGFVEPLVNPTVAGLYRPDLCWAGIRLVVEYDGRHHRDDLDQWDHDIERNEWFERHRWLMVHVVARGIFQRPDETIERVMAAWCAQGGTPFRPSDEWRAHFSVSDR